MPTPVRGTLWVWCPDREKAPVPPPQLAHCTCLTSAQKHCTSPRKACSTIHEGTLGVCTLMAMHQTHHCTSGLKMVQPSPAPPQRDATQHGEEERSPKSIHAGGREITVELLKMQGTSSKHWPGGRESLGGKCRPDPT